MNKLLIAVMLLLFTMSLMARDLEYNSKFDVIVGLSPQKGEFIVGNTSTEIIVCHHTTEKLKPVFNTFILQPGEVGKTYARRPNDKVYCFISINTSRMHSINVDDDV